MKYLYLLPLLFFFSNNNRPAETKPNIIILFCDDLGYGDLGVYGHPTIRTPSLDRMANKGMKFTSFYSGSPACTASRYALLTGRYPVRSGFSWVLTPNSSKGIHPREYTLAEGLKAEGYATGCFGKWHLGTAIPAYSPLSNGFDEYLGLPYSNDMIPPIYGKIALLDGRDTIVMGPNQKTLTKAYTDRAIEFIKKHKEDPFFVYLPYAMPHVPLHPGEAFAGKSTRGTYGDVVEEIDWSAGAILEAVKREGLSKNTIIIFTSDNGPWLMKKEKGGSAGLLRDGKGSTWEGGMRVPAIAVWDGKIPEGKVNNTAVGAIDLHSTFLTLAGHERPKENIGDGQDIMDVFLSEKTILTERPLFYYGNGNNKLMAVRKGPWKLHIQTKSQLEKDYFEKEMPLLFNLDTDPSEKYELSRKYPDVVKTLLNEIEKQETRVKAEPNFFALEAKTSLQKHLAFEKKIFLKTAPAVKYGKENTLLDGMKKTPDDYAELPGFEGSDLEASIDLGMQKQIKSIEVGFIKAHNSWIFLPQKISFYGSKNGQDFETFGTMNIGEPKKNQFNKVHYFEQQVKGEFRWIKVVAENIGLCPDWHFGKGKPAWIFADEVTVR